ncbi:MAG TPA: DegT/DnrJ/EryC1/StrS family aminotransferase [Candidatus Caccenecus avistercoris]|nr:DegT/DnrJ/EryC1/StrS family aminotransferase [Candidatus Caccenecus avistercoris]
MKKINVTKSYLPPYEEYITEIKKIWDNNILTNYGPINIELQNKLEKYLDIDKVHFVNNGTIALLLAIDCLGLENVDIITTPFSFIATASSIVWQKCKPIFVDINPESLNIDPEKIEEKITPRTKAILAVHCFGIPCDVEKIQEIAQKNNLFVIYDAAHAFGVKYKNKSLLSYGDISCCSLHATKIYHSVEGGLCVVNNKKYEEKMEAIKKFGTINNSYKFIGINAKNSEFHAAMGICVLNHLDEIILTRKRIYQQYVKELKDLVEIPSIPKECEYNYIYFPVIFKSEERLLRVVARLNENNIYPRRYFYPSLSSLNIFGNTEKCEISLDISKRILCLPFDTYIENKDIKLICKIIRECEESI